MGLYTPQFPFGRAFIIKQAMKFLSTLLLLLLAAGAGFAQELNAVVVSFDHEVNDERLVLNSSEFSIWNGKKVKLSRAEFYLSEIEIIRPDGSTVMLTNQHILASATSPAQAFDLGQWPVSAANGLVVRLGVDPAHNHTDPASYPAEHPLAPKNPSMHWGWVSGYRFMAIEGRIDNNNDGVPESALEFHNLGDELYTNATITGTATAENGVLNLHLKLDYAKLFEDMPLSGNLINHGSFTANQEMMDNAALEGFLTLGSVTSTDELANNALRVSVAPNPWAQHTWLQYDLPAKDGLELVLTNALGQEVRRLTALPASGQLSLERDGLSAGLYQAAFYTDGYLLAVKPLMIQD